MKKYGRYICGVLTIAALLGTNASGPVPVAWAAEQSGQDALRQDGQTGGEAREPDGGQNVGAGRLDRISQGLKSCIMLGAGYSVAALFISIFLGRPLATLFLDVSELAVIDNVRFMLIMNTVFFFPLALVNIIRFLIQGMGFPTFAILAGVFEMLARGLAGFLLVPLLGFTGVTLGSPIAWIFADAFLIPAYFHVRRTLEAKLAEGTVV